MKATRGRPEKPCITGSTFERKDKPYLNFTAKLTIGVLANMKHIQYSVNKIEVRKQKT